jgi:Protein of unknown function (DUF3043)
VFRRRSQDEQAAASTVTTDAAGRDRDPQAPKGRPTPKRNAAQSQRRTAASRPADRKSANRQVRDARRVELAKQREALAGGDERYLPARDKGPVRRACREYIDSRWHVAELFLPLAVVILVLSMIPNLRIKDVSLLLWLVLIVLIVGQSVITGFRLRGELSRRFPNDNTRGAVAYSLMRTLQMRRMRLPKPQVKRGAPVSRR